MNCDQGRPTQVNCDKGRPTQVNCDQGRPTEVNCDQGRRTQVNCDHGRPTRVNCDQLKFIKDVRQKWNISDTGNKSVTSADRKNVVQGHISLTVISQLL